MPAAAEDDEEVRGRAAFAGWGTAPVEGGEDVDETELCCWFEWVSSEREEEGGLTKAVVRRIRVEARM